MADKRKELETGKTKKTSEGKKLELNKETVQDLSAGEAEDAQGGLLPPNVVRAQSRDVCIA
jgi:hypothetical protein